MAKLLELDVDAFQAALRASNNKELAEKAGVAYNTVRYHLTNKNSEKIPVGTFMKLCAAMGVDHQSFLKVANPST